MQLTLSLMAAVHVLRVQPNIMESVTCVVLITVYYANQITLAISVLVTTYLQVVNVSALLIKYKMEHLAIVLVLSLLLMVLVNVHQLISNLEILASVLVLPPNIMELATSVISIIVLFVSKMLNVASV